MGADFETGETETHKNIFPASSITFLNSSINKSSNITLSSVAPV